MTDYGVSVQVIETGHGILDITLFGGFSKFFPTEQQGFGVALDLDRVVLKPIPNRDTKMQINIETPGQDAKEGQFITEMGFSLRSLPHHRVIKNLT